jgi:hypothetical protein
MRGAHLLERQATRVAGDFLFRSYAAIYLRTGVEGECGTNLFSTAKPPSSYMREESSRARDVSGNRTRYHIENLTDSVQFREA